MCDDKWLNICNQRQRIIIIIERWVLTAHCFNGGVTWHFHRDRKIKWKTKQNQKNIANEGIRNARDQIILCMCVMLCICARSRRSESDGGHPKPKQYLTVLCLWTFAAYKQHKMHSLSTLTHAANGHANIIWRYSCQNKLLYFTY